MEWLASILAVVLDKLWPGRSEAREAVQHRMWEAADNLHANVQRANAYLRQLIDNAERWSVAGRGVHQNLEECRQEFVALRPILAPLREREAVERIGAWYDDVRRTCDAAEAAFGAWTKTLELSATVPMPPNLLTSPIVRRLSEYKGLLQRGVELATLVLEIKTRVERKGKPNR